VSENLHVGPDGQVYRTVPNPEPDDQDYGYLVPERLDLDAYLSWMRIDHDRILHLGCRLTPEGARLAAERLCALADEIEESS
jgi:hypothetical protein